MERSIQYRVALVAVALCVLAGGIGCRLYKLQIDDSANFVARARGQHERTELVWGRRGAIVDRRGREVAVSIDSSSLYAHPRRVEAPGTTAQRLATVLGVPHGRILEKLESDEPFVWLERRLDTRAANAIRGLDLPVGPSEALNFQTEGKRYYPHAQLGAHVIGCTDIDQTGIEGIELVYDDILRGDPATYLAVRDGHGDGVLQLVNAPVRQPRDVVLTLDLVLQHIVERELEAAVKKTGSNWGSAVFIDPATGEVLAMANYPAPDPNHFGRAGVATRRNRALTDLYEPGSTFKIVSAAAVLEHGTVHPEQRFNCGKGARNFGGRRVRDSSPHGVLSFRQIIEESSNAGMVSVVQSLGRQRLYDSVLAFGFSARTGIELPGEQGGTLREPSRWSDYTAGSLSFGHEITATPLQMAVAFATVANGGIQVSPRIVLGTRGDDGRLEREPKPEPRRVISRQTAVTLTGMLEGVVIRGTGKLAGVYGYRIAGKTGTAQKVVGGRYSDTDFVASFGGYGPVSAPRLAGLIVLDEPRGDLHTGGVVAAPVFGQVMAEALAYLRVPPDDAPLLGIRMPSRSVEPVASSPRSRVNATAEIEPGATRVASRAGP
ncbi:MAG: penicillin-binding protein 2 [Acidobacteriota bacterium]|nr:penicillin-binding protein 2 [Acidobacteriota bacterium]